MTKNRDRKQAVRSRMAADQVPYTEAARRVDAEKSAPAQETGIHAMNGSGWLCGRTDRRPGDRVVLDPDEFPDSGDGGWNTVTCEDCHRARAQRRQMAAELADVLAGLARQYVIDTGGEEQPEQAFSRAKAKAHELAVADYDRASDLAGHLAAIRERYLADREDDPEEALAHYRYSYLAVSSGVPPVDPVRPADRDAYYGGHEFEYESHTDLFKCTECGKYEITARKNAPEGSPITPCPGLEAWDGDHRRVYLMLTETPGLPTGRYETYRPPLAYLVRETGLGRSPRSSRHGRRQLIETAPVVADELTRRIESMTYTVREQEVPVTASVRRIDAEVARNFIAVNRETGTSAYDVPAGGIRPVNRPPEERISEERLRQYNDDGVHQCDECRKWTDNTCAACQRVLCLSCAEYADRHPGEGHQCWAYN